MPLPRRKTFNRTAGVASAKSASVSDLVGSPVAGTNLSAQVVLPVAPVVQPVTFAKIQPTASLNEVGKSFSPVAPQEDVISFRERNTGYVNGNDLNTPTQYVQGILDIQQEGHGFLRPKFIPSDKDIYISQSQIRKFQLRPGDLVGGQAREPKEN